MKRKRRQAGRRANLRPTLRLEDIKAAPQDSKETLVNREVSSWRCYTIGLREGKPVFESCSYGLSEYPPFQGKGLLWAPLESTTV